MRTRHDKKTKSPAPRITQTFIQIGFPILGLGLPEVDEIAPLVAKKWAEGSPVISVPTCPLMHGTGMWLGAMMPHCAGGA